MGCGGLVSDVSMQHAGMARLGELGRVLPRLSTGWALVLSRSPRRREHKVLCLLMERAVAEGLWMRRFVRHGNEGTANTITRCCLSWLHLSKPSYIRTCFGELSILYTCMSVTAVLTGPRSGVLVVWRLV